MFTAKKEKKGEKDTAGFSKVDAGLITPEELLLVVEAVSLDRGQLVLVLLNYFLQRAVQLLLLLLKKLLLLEEGQFVIRERTWKKRRQGRERERESVEALLQK